MSQRRRLQGLGSVKESGLWFELSGVEGEGREWAAAEGWECEGRDGVATKWVPDHAVSHCMGCDTAFWAINRRHHCRCCGKVFCSRCSQGSCPVPAEALFHPVRVCNACYFALNHHPPPDNTSAHNANAHSTNSDSTNCDSTNCDSTNCDSTNYDNSNSHNLPQQARVAVDGARAEGSPVDGCADDGS